MINLGDPFYQKGRECENTQHFELARLYYQKAIEQGHLKANTNLGFLFLQGLGGPVNKQKAWSYFWASACRGHVRAMVNLANMLEFGDGWIKDESQALYWYQQAADHGYQEAVLKIQVLTAKQIDAFDSRKKWTPHFKAEQASIASQVQHNLAVPQINVRLNYLKRHSLLPEALAFERFLTSVNRLSFSRPSCFISYAWKTDPQENADLQAWISNLVQFLQRLGIKSFIDFRNMQGHLRHCMQKNLESSDYVLLIGTPGLKSRLEPDRFYRVKSATVLSKIREGLVFIDRPESKSICLMQNGKIDIKSFQEDLGLSNITWIRKNEDIEEALIGEKENIVIERFLGLFGRNGISNLKFELGLSFDKVSLKPNSLIPILYEGSYSDSFPENILKILIEDFRHAENYYQALASYSRPAGLILKLCPELQGSEVYKSLWEGFSAELELLELKEQLTFSRNTV